MAVLAAPVLATAPNHPRAIGHVIEIMEPPGAALTTNPVISSHAFFDCEPPASPTYGQLFPGARLPALIVPAPPVEPEGFVSVVGAAAMNIASGNLSIALDRPTTAAVDDLLVATIMRRSDAVNVPAGWTLVSTAGAVGSLTQYVDVYTKTAVAGDLSGTETFSQASANRMIGQIIALRGSTGTPVLEDSQASHLVSDTALTLPVPALVSLGNRLAVVVGSLAYLIAAVNSRLEFRGGLDWYQRGFAPMENNRLSVATHPMNPGETTACTMTQLVPAPATVGNVFITLALLFKAP